MRSGKTVMMATGESGGFDDLIWSALPGLHTITLSLSHVAGRPYGALYALYSGRKVGHIELELLELLAGHASVALSNVTAFEEVVRQRAHERAVIDASADGIAVLDADGLVRQWNPAAHRLTGVSAEDATGKPPPFPLPEPGAKLTHKLHSGRWLDVLCTGLDGRDEQVLDFRDVTAAKELEEAKDLFLATTSHELRTPITVVQGFASTLASRWDKLTDADRRSAVQTIAERAGSPGQAGRAAAARLPGGRRPADGQQRAVRPGRAAARGGGRVPPAVRPAHAARPTSPTTCRRPTATRWPPTSSSASCWRTRSSTRPTAGRSPCGPAQAGDRIEVTVEDEGIGIPPADRERVFERFVQGETGDRRRFGGIGLGLYIVRQLARAQDGEVAVGDAGRRRHAHAAAAALRRARNRMRRRCSGHRPGGRSQELTAAGRGSCVLVRAGQVLAGTPGAADPLPRSPGRGRPGAAGGRRCTGR